MRCTRPASVTTYSAKPPGAEAIMRSPGLIPSTSLPTASTSPAHSKPSRAPTPPTLPCWWPKATSRSARLRLEARTRIRTSFGFGAGFGRSRISTPLSPKTAARMVHPPVAPILYDVVSLMPCRVQLLRQDAAREPFTDEPAYPPAKDWRFGLPARLPFDLRPGSRDL